MTVRFPFPELEIAPVIEIDWLVHVLPGKDVIVIANVLPVSVPDPLPLDPPEKENVFPLIVAVALNGVLLPQFPDVQSG